MVLYAAVEHQSSAPLVSTVTLDAGVVDVVKTSLRQSGRQFRYWRVMSL